MLSFPIEKLETGFPVSSKPIYTLPPFVFTKAETVSITASVKLDLNSICWFSIVTFFYGEGAKFFCCFFVSGFQFRVESLRFSFAQIALLGSN
jgi:hypothetical protein